MAVTKHRSGTSVITDIFPKGQAEFIHGDTMTVALWKFDQDGGVPSHQHPHEQITHCLEGTLAVTVDSEVIVLEAGDSVVIPGGVEHEAHARTAARGFDVFHPVREDYRL
ncbi:cupin domain-containing protein [Streptomyces botrytidirepellens]|uniref:Cupin domain-containing protein n=1 Tax=Streptomyces botrytidirepellens TaxID=2486417 RepID=A0A3M8S9G8_9ACTN|nr:cupin domain-containing protein [Streptomyces botrytidirepellens]RNF77727.1 cupin domain-containing protein [Streptomyces botrytidirepellens]